MIALHRKLCNWKPPELLVNQIVKRWGDEGLIWLDGEGSTLGRWVTIAVNPIETICCHELSNQSENPFTLLKQLPPGHWTGWLSYEAAKWIEPSISWQSDKMAILWLAHHDPIFKFDLDKQELWLEGTQLSDLESIAKWINNEKNYDLEQSNKNIELSVPLDSWYWHTEEDEYMKRVQRLKRLISEGDIFQANLSCCCTYKLNSKINIIDTFKKLRRKSPAPFGGLIIGNKNAKGEAILSTSPERFLKVTPKGKVETRPIKGTRPRNKDKKKDAQMAIELICSEKDRAENIMIVDLLRNDLGKVCTPGSIKVSDLLNLESFQQVHHLTSVVEGQLRTDKSWVDLLEACWPGGSITGAPKLRACQRLSELEPIARGPYCGSLINIDWEGKFDSNILIRSLILKDSTLRVNAGCGIVADSDPETEMKELRWKLNPIIEALQ